MNKKNGEGKQKPEKSRKWEHHTLCYTSRTWVQVFHTELIVCLPRQNCLPLILCVPIPSIGTLNCENATYLFCKWYVLPKMTWQSKSSSCCGVSPLTVPVVAELGDMVAFSNLSISTVPYICQHARKFHRGMIICSSRRACKILGLSACSCEQLACASPVFKLPWVPTGMNMGVSAV